MNLSPEDRLLIIAGKPKSTPDDRERAGLLIQSVLSWEILWAKAQFHGFVPLLYRFLSNLEPSLMNDEFFQRMKTRSLDILKLNLRLGKEFLILNNLFLAQGIPAIGYKGPVLAEEIWEGIGFRQFVDLDFFIPTLRNCQRARDLLISRGYVLRQKMNPAQDEQFSKTQCEYQLFKPTSHIFIDLHWAPFYDYFSFHYDHLEAWKRLKSRKILDQEMPSFSPEDQIVILCAHAAKHQWDTLSRIRDIALIPVVCPELNWDLVLRLAERSSCPRMLLMGLSLAHSVFGISLPGKITEAIRQEPVIHRLMKKTIKRLFQMTASDLTFLEAFTLHMNMRTGWKNKLQCGLFGLFTPSFNDYSWISLPPKLFHLY